MNWVLLRWPHRRFWWQHYRRSLLLRLQLLVLCWTHGDQLYVGPWRGEQDGFGGEW